MRSREERRKETEFQGTPKRLKLEGFHKTVNCRGKVPWGSVLECSPLTLAAKSWPDGTGDKGSCHQA